MARRATTHRPLVALLELGDEDGERLFEFSDPSHPMRVAVTVAHSAWVADPTTAHYRAAARVLERHWGVAPLYVREGGTSVLTQLLGRVLQAPVMLVPLGQSSDSAHLPNERIRLHNLNVGRAVMRDLFAELAETT